MLEAALWNPKNPNKFKSIVSYQALSVKSQGGGRQQRAVMLRTDGALAPPVTSHSPGAEPVRRR
jgi:hypothetical protein